MEMINVLNVNCNSDDCMITYTFQLYLNIYGNLSKYF